MSAATFILCTVLGSSGSFAFWESGLLYEGESIYNYLQVKDSEDDVILSTNVLFGVQSIMKKHLEGNGNILIGIHHNHIISSFNGI